MDRHFYLLAYDISDNRRRVKLCDMAQRFATGGQKSAYECWLSPGEAAAIRAFCAGLIEEGETSESFTRALDAIDPEDEGEGGLPDSIMLLRLDVRAATRQLGRGQPPSDPDIFIFG
ncbi:MAG: hypothetical protein ACK4XK_09825 [Casimicrobiaceae bacterium]